MAKIIHSLTTNERISLMTDTRSVCELSADVYDDWRESLHELTEMTLDSSVKLFFFNRIKAYKERKGDGTLLMNELVCILDREQITVLNCLSPYGKMKLSGLVRFNEKFGFEIVFGSVKKGEVWMLRKPKEWKENEDENLV